MVGVIMKQNSYNQDYRIHNELIQLRRRVEGFESGEIYQKFKNEYEKKLALKDREINRLTKRNDLLENKNRLLLSENEQLKTNMFFLNSDVDRLTRWVKARDTKSTQKLEFDTDYKVLCYENNMNKGTAKVTFIGMGDFTGTKTVSFKVNQRNVASNWFERLAQVFGF